MKKLLFLMLALLIINQAFAGIDNFDQSKRKLKESVYFDQVSGGEGTFYCGCDWSWVGASGGRVDAKSCGYQARAQEVRAKRTEWEHVVPAWLMGHQRQCWQKGGRKNCRTKDATFRLMEADPHNLVVSIGEANADRSNFSFGVLPDKPTPYGSCDLEVDFKRRMIEPRDVVKGQIARIYFYMHDRYSLQMSRKQQQLMMAWHKQYPVTTWELERDSRIAKIAGHHNDFVTGKKVWSLGHKNVAERFKKPVESKKPTVSAKSIRGNKRSKIYHLAVGCPSYSKISQRNVVEFPTESDAQQAGYRKAKNCS